VVDKKLTKSAEGRAGQKREGGGRPRTIVKKTLDSTKKDRGEGVKRHTTSSTLKNSEEAYLKRRRTAQRRTHEISFRILGAVISDDHQVRRCEDGFAGRTGPAGESR